MAANNFFGYGQPATASAYAGVGPPPPAATAYSQAAAAGVTPAVPVAAPPGAGPPGGVAAPTPAGVAATQFAVAQSQPPPPPPPGPQPPPQAGYRPAPAAGQAVIAYSAYQPVQPAGQQSVSAASYASPHAASAAAPTTLVVTSAYPTTTYHPSYPPATVPSVAAGLVAAAAQAQAQQVYNANKPSYYVPPPTSASVAHYQPRPAYSASAGVPTSTNPAASHAAVSSPAARPVRPANYSATGYGGVSTPSYSAYGGPSHTVVAATATHKYAAASTAAAAVSGPPAATSGAVAPQPHGPWINSHGHVHPPHAPPQPPRQQKVRQPPKPQQLHYCDICKISCAGPQTYQEHLEGQKHKKKLAAAAAASASPVTSVTSPSGAMQHQGGFQSGGGQGGGPHRGGPRVGNALRCELCDVTCTGSDAYAAHIRGSKHQKVIKLHTKLGKPIPSVNPVIVNSSKVGPPVANNNGNLGEDSSSSQSNPQAAKKPRINIVRKEANDKTIGVSMSNGNNGGNTNKNNSSNGGCPEVVNIPLLPDEKVVQPVGSDYIEEVRSEDGSKILSFFCKLCECKFNDPNAKEMHMKGRRHRLQYKKKVNPNLVVDLKPSLRQRKLQEERAKRSMAKEDFWRRRDEEFRAMEEEERNMMWMNGPPPPGGPYPVPPHHPHPGAMMMRRPDSSDDRHVMAKHTTIYPTEDSLALIQKQVAFVERGLKMVSDEMAATGEASATGSSEPTGKSKTNGADETSEAHPTSKLKGVMRVGPLAKGLLLRADSKVDLVLLCSEVPTKSLLKEVSSKLTKHLETVTKSDDGVKFVVKENTKEASVEVVSDSITVSVGLTSPLVRNSNNDEFTSDGDVKPSDKEDNNVLDRDKCIEFLAHVRHAKWFTARAASLQSCVMVLRVLRDLVSWSPSWQPLPAFALELIAEKTLASAGLPMSPGDALRRILESLAGGLLLPGSPGLLDPCEKEPRDAASSMSAQEREDLTTNAQTGLRQIAFRQIHKFLAMEQLPPMPKFPTRSSDKSGGRKRPASAGGDDVEDGSEAGAAENGGDEGSSNGEAAPPVKKAKTDNDISTKNKDETTKSAVEMGSSNS